LYGGRSSPCFAVCKTTPAIIKSSMVICGECNVMFIFSLPNKAPEPTVGIASGSSLGLGLLFGLVPRWLSFFR
jgi:hypothetical protein